MALDLNSQSNIEIYTWYSQRRIIFQILIIFFIMRSLIIDLYFLILKCDWWPYISISESQKKATPLYIIWENVLYLLRIRIFNMVNFPKSDRVQLYGSTSQLLYNLYAYKNYFSSIHGIDKALDDGFYIVLTTHLTQAWSRAIDWYLTIMK